MLNRPLTIVGPDTGGYSLTEELKAYMTPYNPKAKQYGIPPAKIGVIVIHASTRRFYSTVVTNHNRYYGVMKKEIAGYDQLALPLLRMLEKNPNFDFYTVAETTRNYVEHALVKIGLMRASTGRGEIQKEDHALFKIYCPTYKFARFTIAPKITENEKLVKKANESINSWLEKLTVPHGRLKVRLRDGLNKRRDPNREVFGIHAIVTLERLVFDMPREYSKITTKMNLDEVQKFLLRATGAVV